MNSHIQPRAPLAGAYDVVIIGGGVNGVAIARECALAGRRTLLLEQHDYSSGTTSRATRIIHGGLRYLEHGEIALVRESLREREQLLAQRSHLVRPMNFLLALPPGRRSALEVRFGLWLYRRFSHAPRRYDASGDTANLHRFLDSDGRWTVFAYDDAQCAFPERLVTEWLLEAVNAGCVARNYTQVLTVRTRDGRATGVHLRNLLSRNECFVTARWVINATGPWADRVARESGIHMAKPMVGGVRGSHIVLPRFTGAPRAAIYTEGPDGRPVFVIPWNGQLLVGTTEVHDDGDPARVQPAPQEIQYLFSCFRRLFPAIPISHEDVKLAFAGIRPLAFTPSGRPSAITRRHFLISHASEGAEGMISVIGGKLTTAAALARQCARRIGSHVPEPNGFMLDANNLDDQISCFLANITAGGVVDPPTARALATWHGHRALDIAQLAAQDPRLAARLCPHSDHIVAEAVDAYRSQMAVTLADVLLRRVPVALGSCWEHDCTRTAAERIGSVLEWSEAEIGAQADAAEQERLRSFVRLPAADLTAEPVLRRA